MEWRSIGVLELNRFRIKSVWVIRDYTYTKLETEIRDLNC